MRNRILAACLILIGLAALTTVGLVAADKPTPSKEPAGYDFGKKVLIVTVRPVGKVDVNSRVVEGVKARQLGETHFLVGQTPDLGAEFTTDKGTTVWIPVSEVVQITEYDSLDAVKKVYEQQGKRKSD
jgi:hypothetical protein